jgi:S-adenosylmethionine hydrolase
MPQYDSIAFISDMGIKDESVGVCKAVMLQQAPHVTILDITHQVPVFDVRAGALALTRAIQFLPSGVIVAAVDPGSPRDQRYIAVDMGEGVLIGPDNGILAPATQLIGMPKRVHEITNPDYRIEAPGAVFAARDILAPAAGVIAAGVDLAELGPAVPLEQLVPGMLQLARHDEGGAFLGEVWSLDHFGNIQVNITPEEIASRGAKVGDTVIVRVGETDHIAKYVERYADLAVSQLGILVDSTGMISVVKNLDSAARELDIREGKAITILPPNTSVTGRDITIESVAQTPAEAPQSAAPEINLPSDSTGRNVSTYSGSPSRC